MTASLIIAALAVLSLLVATVCVTVTFRQALREMSRARDRDSERRDAQMSALLDRFQAIRWEDLAAMRSLTEEPSDEGGFFSPEDQRAEAGVEVEEPGRWGPMSRLATVHALDENERALLEEDFPDESR